MVSQNTGLLKLIDSFAEKKLLVIGEAMLDSYLVGTSDRICQEAPVPIVDVQERVYVPGGAANTAVNLRSLDAKVCLLSVIGDDEDGRNLLKALDENRVPARHILKTSARTTLSKQRIVSGSQVIVRFDQGSTDPLDPEVEEQLVERLNKLYHECDGVVVSDYDYGILSPSVIKALGRLQREEPKLVVVDSKRYEQYRHLNVTAVKPNYEETVRLLGLEKIKDDAERLRQVQKHGKRVLRMTGAQIAAITLDHNGALIFQRGDDQPYRTYASPEPNSKAAGAGDTFVSALAISLAAGAEVEHAAELASAAAEIVVSKDGTASCFAEELKEHFSTGEKFISDVFQLVMRLTFYRRTGRRIVFTNGCFDILHRGHIAYLNRAKALGDILIVGLNSDNGVRKLKGPDRPINSLEDRAQVLAALSCVDHIISFDEETPEELIRIIRPDVFAKGGDYTLETLPEARLVYALGGQVELLPYVADHSTTSVIEKIRATFSAQAAQPQGQFSGAGGSESDEP